MKCPKCSYLGFETGDRCKNCGYDFSLLAVAEAPEPQDPDLKLLIPDEIPTGADTSWMDRLHMGTEDVAEAHEMPEPPMADPSATITLDPPVTARAESPFPLFEPGNEQDDEPLIKFPAAPRAPLSVRRTPEQPRLRTPTRLAQPDAPPLSLEFSQDSEAGTVPERRVPVSALTIGDAIDAMDAFEPVERVSPAQRLDTRAARVSDSPGVSSLVRRVAAGATDHMILLAIDFIVLYSTLRMAGLTMGDWALLPPVPMIGFLLLLKVSYFGAFTAACGQTIGKMAAHIRVVADDAPLDPARAIRRTILSGVSLLPLGAGFLPALLDPDHRALHDRVAGTRVVELPSA
jgi:uncharacterized RDD family membrane protein YckC